MKNVFFLNLTEIFDTSQYTFFDSTFEKSIKSEKNVFSHLPSASVEKYSQNTFFHFFWTKVLSIFGIEFSAFSLSIFGHAGRWQNAKNQKVYLPERVFWM